MSKNHSCILNFGKYKGAKIYHIMQEDFEYIRWCVINIDWFKLNEYEQKLYDTEISRIRSEELEKDRDNYLKSLRTGWSDMNDWGYHIEEY